MRSTIRSVLLALMAACALTALTASSALASSKPTVETKLPTGVTIEEATLRGTVNPNGAETKYYFEYGETTSYGNKTAEASAGAGTIKLEESNAINGFFLFFPYDYRIVAKNSNGTSYGANVKFGPSSGTTTLRASKTSGTGATLNGSVTLDNVEAKYYFEYGTEPGSLTHKTAEASTGASSGTVELSKAITGLTEGTDYYYRLVVSSYSSKETGSTKEFAAIPQPAFTAAGGKLTATQGSTTFEIGGIANYTYTSSEMTGEIVPPSTVKNVTLRFVHGGFNSCDNGKAGEEELVWTKLTAHLGYINRAKKEVGLVFEPATQPIAVCEGFRGISGRKYYFRGTFAVAISPTGIKTKSFTLKGGNPSIKLAGEEAPPLTLGEAEQPEPWSVSFGAEMTAKTEKEMEVSTP